MKTPSEELGLPVIGKITCKLEGISQGGQVLDFPEDEYEVIKVIEQGDVKVYMCNQWNSEGVVQLVPDVCVIKFEEF